MGASCKLSKAPGPSLLAASSTSLLPLMRRTGLRVYSGGVLAAHLGWPARESREDCGGALSFRGPPLLLFGRSVDICPNLIAIVPFVVHAVFLPGVPGTLGRRTVLVSLACALEDRIEFMHVSGQWSLAVSSDATSEMSTIFPNRIYAGFSVSVHFGGSVARQRQSHGAAGPVRSGRLRYVSLPVQCTYRTTGRAQCFPVVTFVFWQSH